MKKRKYLVLITCDYPIYASEFYLDDEMHIIAKRFDKVYVVLEKQNSASIKREIPNNLEVNTYNSLVSTKDKLKTIVNVFSLFFIKEFVRTIIKTRLKLSIEVFKIMYMDVLKAEMLKVVLNKLISTNNLNISNTIFYSYWHDYSALALSMLKRRNNSFVCISRAHRWDIYYNTHKYPYLPFKSFIINNLSGTYSISLDGKLVFEKLLNTKLDDKVFVSRLGKINNRKPVFYKNSPGIIFCSCSTLTPLKRVHLIIDMLSNLNIANIKWVHFGSGYLLEELEKYAREKISNIDFCFKGIVPNSEILDYYHQNYVDLFINFSESEGIPVSIMEALSAGVPVIATNVGGTREIVNEYIGFLIDADFKIDEITGIIENYLRSPGENQLLFRRQAYKFWQENYNAEKNYNEFVESVLKRQ